MGACEEKATNIGKVEFIARVVKEQESKDKIAPIISGRFLILLPITGN